MSGTVGVGVGVGGCAGGEDRHGEAGEEKEGGRSEVPSPAPGGIRPREAHPCAALGDGRGEA